MMAWSRKSVSRAFECFFRFFIAIIFTELARKNWKTVLFCQNGQHFGNSTLFGLNPRPAGPLDFPPPAGGGRLNAPPMISAPGRRREKRRAAFESSRKIISKSFRSFFGSGQNWGLQGSKFQNFPKRFFDNKIFNFKDRATNLIPLCFSR